MRRNAIRSFLFGSILAFLACAPSVQSPGRAGPEFEDAVEDLASKMIDELVENRKRIMDLEYRLTKAAAPLCGQTIPYPGVLVTRRGEYDHKGVKAAVSNRFAAAEALTIVYVVPQGPFSRARLQAGDRILALDGHAVRTAEDFSTYVLEIEDAGPVRVRFERSGEGEDEFDVHLDRTCPVQYHLASSPLLVPWRNGLIVSVPLGLLKYAENDGVLAVALSHQLAHILFDQPDDDEFQAESMADTRGLRIAKFAGFDINEAANYWENVAIEYPWLALPSQGERRIRHPRDTIMWKRYDSFPHHDIARRMDGIRREIGP